jgi:hypothetical protein
MSRWNTLQLENSLMLPSGRRFVAFWSAGAELPHSKQRQETA